MVDLLKNIYRVFRENTYKVILVFIMTVIVTVLELVEPYFLQILLDNGIGNKELRILYSISGLYILNIILKSVLRYLIQSKSVKIKKKFSMQIKREILERSQRITGKYYTNQKAGELLKVIESDVLAIEDVGINVIIDILINIVSAIVVFVILCSMNFKLLFIIVVLEILMICIQKVYVTFITRKTEMVRNLIGNSMSILEEYISSIMNSIITKADKMFVKKYLNNEKQAIKNACELENLMEKNQLTANSINELMILLTYFLGGIWAIKGRMTVGEILSFSQYIFLLITPIMQLINLNAKMQIGIISARKISEVMSFPVIEDIGKEENIEMKLVEIKHIGFSYSNKEPILSNVSMQFKKGEKIAIIGKSGSGKSTLIKLLYRLWEPDSGEILIDGKSIRKYKLEVLRKKIAVVTQDTILFDDTVWNNILLETTATLEDVEQICEKVQINQIIENLNKGYQTMVGERGIKLSGGQRQRIILARALLQKTPIIILDEATSALDNVMQKEILENIEDILSESITIMITHRMSTIYKADYVYVLEKGKIEEEGKPENLKEKKGIYSKMLLQEIS